MAHISRLRTFAYCVASFGGWKYGPGDDLALRNFNGRDRPLPIALPLEHRERSKMAKQTIEEKWRQQSEAAQQEVLSTPLTLCVVVLARHVDRLQFIDIMLGDQPALTPQQAAYQRMLKSNKPGLFSRRVQSLPITTRY
jgi:hypothetical protein